MNFGRCEVTEVAVSAYKHNFIMFHTRFLTII